MRSFIALFLIIALAVPMPAFALRVQSGDSPSVRAGLEERLRENPLSGGIILEVPVSGLEEVDEARLRPLLHQMLGSDEARLTSRDLRGLRPGTLGWSLPLYADALGVSLQPNYGSLIPQIELLLPAKHSLPPQIAAVFQGILTTSWQDTKPAFLQRVQQAESAIQSYLQTAPADDYWRPYLMRLLDTTPFTQQQRDAVALVSGRLAAAFQQGNAAPQMVSMTRPQSMLAVIEFLDANHVPYGADVTGQNFYLAQFWDLTKRQLSNAQVTFGYPPAVLRIVIDPSNRTISDLAGYAGHEQVHTLLPQKWIDLGQNPSREDWIAESVATVVKEWVAVRENEPFSLNGLAGFGPAVHEWLYRRGQEIALTRQTPAWEGLIRQMDSLPPDPRFYAQGVLIAGIARQLAVETAQAGQVTVGSDDFYGVALQVLGEYALQARTPSLSELGRVAREFRQTRGLPVEPPGAGLEERTKLPNWVKTTALVATGVLIGAAGVVTYNKLAAPALQQPGQIAPEVPGAAKPQPPAKTEPQKEAPAAAVPQAKKDLDQLAERLGPNRMIVPVVWGDPADILEMPDFFDRMVEARMKAVFIASKFTELPVQKQQAIIDQAKKAKLPVLGVMFGNPDWVLKTKHGDLQNRVNQFRDSLLKLDVGNELQFILVFDIEPHAKEWRAVTGWNGDLAGYSTVIQDVIPPLVADISKKASDKFGRPVLYETPVIYFEPHWWVNGHQTEDGLEIRNLKYPSDQKMGVAGMTYQPNAQRISAVFSRVSARASAAPNVRTFYGLETKPGIIHTFDGRLGEVPKTLLDVYEGLPKDAQDRVLGPFIHIGSAGEIPGTRRAYQIVGEWLGKSAQPPAQPPAQPAKRPAAFGVEGDKVKEFTAEKIELKLLIPQEWAGKEKELVAVVLRKTDTYYVQKKDRTTSAFRDVPADGVVTVGSDKPLKGEKATARAVVILRRADTEEFMKVYNEGRAQGTYRAVERYGVAIIAVEEDGRARVVKDLPRGGLEELLAEAPARTEGLPQIITRAGEALRRLRPATIRQVDQSHILYDNAAVAALALLHVPHQELSPNIAVVDAGWNERLARIAFDAGFSKEQVRRWQENYLIVYDRAVPGDIRRATQEATIRLAERLPGVSPRLIHSLPAALDEFGFWLKYVLDQFGLTYESGVLTQDLMEDLYRAVQA